MRPRQKLPAFFGLALVIALTGASEASNRLGTGAAIHAGPLGRLEVSAHHGTLDGIPVIGLARVEIISQSETTDESVRRARWRRPAGWNGTLPATDESDPFHLNPTSLEEALNELGWDRALWTELLPRSTRLEYRVDRDGELRLTQTFSVSRLDAQPTTRVEEFRVALDREGSLVEVAPTGWYASVDGQIFGRIPEGGKPFSPSATFATLALPFLNVNAIGFDPEVTDSDGFFTFDVPATAAIVVSGGLTGPLFSVQNQAGPAASFLLFLTEGLGITEIEFNETPTEFSTAETSAYAAVSNGYRFINRIAPGFGPAQLPVNLNVNVAGSCFAFYSEFFQSVNFSQAGGGCPNTAYGTIAAHEYYHHLQVGLPAAEPAFREAMADVFAAYTYSSPIIGPDYFGPTTQLRNLEDLSVFPVVSTDPSEEGQPLAAAFWDLLQALIATEGNTSGALIAGELWLAVQLISAGQVDNTIVADLLFVDDDDGDLSNGTPHFGEIVGAFAAHGFDAPVPPVESFTCTPSENRVLLAWEPPAGVLFDSFQIFRGGTLIGLAPGIATSYEDLFPPFGLLEYELIPTFDASVTDSSFCTTELAPYSPFVRGDANRDGGLLLNDPIAVLDYLFVTATPPTPCLDALDSDDNGAIQIGDAVILMQFLFAAGPPPLAPFPLLGFDPTPDTLPCP